MTLFQAVESGDVAALKTAISETIDVNELGPDKRTALIDAAAKGWLEGVTLLLAAGAEPEWRDSLEETALLKAAANGHLEVARALAKTASDDDKSLASSFLKAFGASHAPEFKYEEESSLKRKAVQVVARAANFVGDEDPLMRLERQDRAEENAKKKR